LYVAENASEVLRLPPSGTVFERHPIEFSQLDGLIRTRDCAIWFVAGSNTAIQHVGKLLVR
jgi:hypothetical protein